MASPGKKRAIIALHERHCVYCGEQFDEAELTIDHVQPKMRGGDHSRGNLVASCRPCNVEKGGAAAWAYLAGRPEQRANFLQLARWIWPRHRTAVEEAADRGTGAPDH